MQPQFGLSAAAVTKVIDYKTGVGLTLEITDSIRTANQTNKNEDEE